MTASTTDGFADAHTLRRSGLRLFERRVPAGTRLGRHVHDEWRYCLTVRGAYTVSWRRGHRTRTPGHLSLHPAGESHTSIFHDEVRSFHIELTGAWRDRLLRDAGVRPEAHEFLDGRAPRIADQIRRESAHTDRAVGLVLEGLVCELIGWSAREARRERGGASWVFRARDLLRDRVTESLSLGDVASVVGVHPVHLARQFRRTFGCSVGEYVRQARVERACRALLGDAPLSAIALDAGFADQSHFTRVFRRETGMTPGEFRARNRVAR
ncbi:MAG TPA: AraC family transcriptional regulator [Gemmatimonadaceae bacterium]